MKHDIIRADVNSQKIGFLFECKYFDRKGDLNKIKNSSLKKFYILPEKAVGQNYILKINKLLNILKKKKVDFQFISASENIAWLLNIRGKDSEFTPMPNACLLYKSTSPRDLTRSRIPSSD